VSQEAETLGSIVSYFLSRATTSRASWKLSICFAIHRRFPPGSLPRSSHRQPSSPHICTSAIAQLENISFRLGRLPRDLTGQGCRNGISFQFTIWILESAALRAVEHHDRYWTATRWHGAVGCTHSAEVFATAQAGRHAGMRGTPITAVPIRHCIEYPVGRPAITNAVTYFSLSLRKQWRTSRAVSQRRPSFDHSEIWSR